MRFHYFYCVIGLGLIAVLLTAIYDFASAMKEGAQDLPDSTPIFGMFFCRVDWC